MATVLDTLATDIEQVSSTVPNYYLTAGTFLSQFSGVEKIGANRKAAVIMFKHFLGGVQHRINTNGGSLANGTGPKNDKFTCGWINSMLSFQFTQEQLDIGNQGTSITKMNVLADIVANAMESAIVHDERDLFGSGDGVLTNSATTLSTVTVTDDTLTFNGASDYLGVNRLMEGDSVDVWDTTLATLRAGGPFQITVLDSESKKATLLNSAGAAPVAMAATDRLSVVNLNSFTPATPTAGSSTWPAGGSSSATGFTGDSWRHGLAAVNNNTGYYMTKNRATIPVLAATAVSANSDPISMWHFELAKTGMIQRFGNDAWKSQKWVIHHANMLMLKQNVQTTSQWNRTGGEKMPDQVPTDHYGEFFNVADMPCFSHKMAARDRADSYDPGDWLRVEGHPTGWFKPEGSSSFVTQDRNGDGLQIMSYNLRMKQMFDWGNKRPGYGAFISSITPPTTPY